MVIAGLSVVLLLDPVSTVAAPRATTTTVPCQSPRLSNDSQIDQCLVSGIRSMTRRMNTALRKESAYLHYPSRSQDWRVARRAQATFVAYVREECLAEANPYQPGTIVPILYGECVIGLYQQRLANIDAVITSFRKGGESQPSR